MVDLKVDLIIQQYYFWWQLNTVNFLWLFLNVGWSAVCDCAISWSYPLFNKLLFKLQTSFIQMNFITFFTGPSKAVLLLWIFFLHLYFVLVCLFLAALWSPAGKGLTSWLSCMWCFLVFCHFPTWCPGSGVVFDCINSWYFLSSYLKF